MGAAIAGPCPNKSMNVVEVPLPELNKGLGLLYGKTRCCGRPSDCG